MTKEELKKEAEQRENNRLSDNLSKAKEIMTNILTNFPDYKVKTFDDMSLLNALVKAEQFLKEE